jgi:UDP-perosamine 4-acetyltransferase
LRTAVVIGSGGHAKVVIDILREHGDITLAGCISRDTPGEAANGVPVLGGDEMLPDMLEKGVTSAIVALGDNRLRLRMLNYVISTGFDLLNAVSRHAVVSPSVRVGAGTVIMPGAIVNAETCIADGVIINTGATVDHDCHLAAGAHVGPGANLAGCVHIETGAFIGTGACVIPRMRVGAWSVVGAGAVVISDVPDNSVCAGVPARFIRSSRR